MREDEMRAEKTPMASDYNEPPEVPTEEIWAGIRAELERSGSIGPRSLPSGRVIAWAAAAAVVLFLGVGIGSRLEDGSPEERRSDATPPERGAQVEGGANGVLDGARVVFPTSNPIDVGGGSLQRAATDFLSASETFLAMVRRDARQGRLEPEIGGWARNLLTETRLLMDSPISSDPEVALLLGELELTLIQVVQAARTQQTDSSRSSRELELLTTRLESSNMAPRIEAMTPALTNGNGS